MFPLKPFLFFLDKVSLCSSNWPGTHLCRPVGLILTETTLALFRCFLPIGLVSTCGPYLQNVLLYGAGVVAQGVKCLMCKTEDLS